VLMSEPTTVVSRRNGVGLKRRNEEPLSEDTTRTTSRTRMSDAEVARARVEVNERKNMNVTSTSSARKMQLNS
jgi:hypothetical protein